MALTGYLRQVSTAVRLLLIATLLLGVVYPLGIWALGRITFPDQAAGSLIDIDGKPAASALIAQSPQQNPQNWFLPRPSAVDGDPSASGASNLGPNDPQLLARIAAARDQVAGIEGVRPEDVPVSAVTMSGSGLDPQISPAYAQLQIPRVARNTGISEAWLSELVAQRTTSPWESLLGQPAVNVTRLNLALAGLDPVGD
ncbi:K(+)-transporting ATPase subunit C [Acaricomes phytoseiuli]|uniref:K(+)-transporting ATPase subunit C n=1 Tax=Acaricomes phytoseiuli TaxID=291968 RepID=UPI00035C995E